MRDTRTCLPETLGSLSHAEKHARTSHAAPVGTPMVHDHSRFFSTSIGTEKRKARRRSSYLPQVRVQETPLSLSALPTLSKPFELSPPPSKPQALTPSLALLPPLAVSQMRRTRCCRPPAVRCDSRTGAESTSRVCRWCHHRHRRRRRRASREKEVRYPSVAGTIADGERGGAARAGGAGKVMGAARDGWAMAMSHGDEAAASDRAAMMREADLDGSLTTIEEEEEAEVEAAGGARGAHAHARLVVTAVATVTNRTVTTTIGTGVSPSVTTIMIWTGRTNATTIEMWESAAWPTTSGTRTGYATSAQL